MSIVTVMSDREALERFKESQPELRTVAQIARMSEDEFVKNYASSSFFQDDVREARRVYQIAVNINARNALLWANIKDLVASPYYRATLFNNIPQEFIKNLENIPGYQRLFGSLDFVDFDHNRSIFGPAAYFVDLLRFIDGFVASNPQANDEAFLLNNPVRQKQRRPDLYTFPLNAQNTDDLIPYIDLVNEVLEAIVRTEEEPDAYQSLDGLNFPNTLPFSKPLAEIREYLGQLGTSLYAIYQAYKRMQIPDAATVAREADREFLGLSPREYALIAQEIAQPQALEQLYGTAYELTEDSMTGLTLSPAALEKLQDIAGRSIVERESFTRMVNSLADKQQDPALAAEIRGNLEQITKAAFNRYDLPRLSSLPVFLEQTGLTRPEMNELLYQDLDGSEINAGLSRLFFINNVEDGLGPLMLADGPSGPQGFDEVLLNLSYAKLDRLYRFVKLARKLGWTFTELDRAIRSLSAPFEPEKTLKFDGIDDYVACRNVTNLDLTSFTVEAWIYPTGQGRQSIMSKGRESDWSLHFLFLIEQDGRLAFYYNPKKEDKLDKFYSGANVIPAGVFTHVAVSVDNEKRELRFYIDGKQDGDPVALDKDQGIEAIGSDLDIGRNLNDNYFSGIITQVRLWANVREQAALSAERYRRLTGREPGLAGYWPLNENRWDRLFDLTPNRNDGLIGGAEFVTQPAWVQRDLVLDSAPQAVARAGYHFNGTDQYLASRKVNWSDLSALSLEAWLKWEKNPKASGYELIACGSEAPGPNQAPAYQFRLALDGEGHLQFQSSTLEQNKLFQSARSLTPSMLTQVAITLPEQALNGPQFRVTDGLLSAIQQYAFPALLQYEESRTDAVRTAILTEVKKLQGQVFSAGSAAFLTAISKAVGAGLLETPVDADANTPTPGGLIDAQIGAGPAVQLNQDMLDQLLNPQITAGIYQQLQNLKGQSFAAKEDFWAALSKAIGDVQVESFTAGILALAEIAYLRLYLDGAPEEFELSNNTPELKSAGTSLSVGRKLLADPDWNYYQGLLKEIRVWDRVRSAEQLSLNSVRAAGAREPGLIGYWRLNEIVDGQAIDLSYNATNLYLGGILKDYMPERVSADMLLPSLPVAVEGSALEFDGERAWAVIQNAENYGLGHYDRVSLALWFNATDPAAEDHEQIILAQGDAEDGLVIYLYKSSLYVAAWADNYQGTALRKILFKADNITAGGWHHVAVSKQESVRLDGSVDLQAVTYRAYLDGTRFGESDAENFRLSPVGSLYLGGLGPEVAVWTEALGKHFSTEPDQPNVNNRHFFGGSLAGLQLWQSIKTEQDFASGRFVAPEARDPNLLAFLPLAETKGTKLVDLAAGGQYSGIYQSNNRVLAVDDPLQNLQEIHAHYSATEALQWTNYVYSGRLYLDDKNASIGVTFFSRYPENQDRYYCLKRDSKNPAFYLSAHPDSIHLLKGTTQSKVTPLEKTWYRFEIEVEAAADRTSIKAKVWPDSASVPADYQLEAYDDSDVRLKSGTVGLWTSGGSRRLFDELQVRPIAAAGAAAPQSLLVENFEEVAPGKLPANWQQSGTRLVDKGKEPLFETYYVRDNLAYGTAQALDNIHSHLMLPDALSWTNYEFSGRMYITESDGGIGVTFFSRYPEGKEQYYRLGRSKETPAFSLATQPAAFQPLSGVTTSGVVPMVHTWYRFRILVEGGHAQTRIRAKVWQHSKEEPAQFQIDAVDASDIRLTSGTIGVWAAGSGRRFVDSLLVAKIRTKPGELYTVLYSESFRNHQQNQHPRDWQDSGARESFVQLPALFKALDVQDDRPVWQTVTNYPLLLKPLSLTALSFDGKLEYAAAKVKGLDNNPFTLEAWLKPAPSLAGPIFTSYSQEGGKAAFQLGVNEAGQLTFAYLKGDGSLESFSGSASLSPAGFSHVALSASGNNLVFYVNGQEDKAVTSAEAPVIGGTYLEVGRGGDLNNPAAPAKYFSGQLRDLRAWKEARAKEQIEAGRFQQPDMSPALAGYWPFDEAAEAILALDHSTVNQNPLRLGGSESARRPVLLDPSVVFSMPEIRDYVLEFDGQDDFISLAKLPGDLKNPLTQRTIELWFKAAEIKANHKQVLYAESQSKDPATNTGLAIYLDGGRLVAGSWSIAEKANQTAEPAQWRGASTGGLEADKWYRVTVVVEGAAGPAPKRGRKASAAAPTAVLRAYLDGVAFSEGSGNEVFPLSQQIDAVYLGASLSGTFFEDLEVAAEEGHYFKGQLRRFALWKVARSEAEISASAELSDPETPGLLCLWTLDQAPATVVEDSTANGYAGLLGGDPQAANAVMRTPDWINRAEDPGPADPTALKLDGQANFVDAAALQPASLDEATFEAWVKPDALNGAATLWEQSNGAVKLAWEGNRLSLKADGCDPQVQTFDYGFDLNEWVHLALLYSREQRKLNLYINGQPQEEKTYQSSAPLAVSAGRIGQSPDGSGSLRGLLKEWRLWSVSRTPAEIKLYMFRRLSGSEKNLVLYQPFNAESGLLNAPAWLTPDLLVDSLGQGFWRSDRPAATFNGLDGLVYWKADSGQASKSDPRRTIEVWFKADDKDISRRKQVIYHEGDDNHGLSIYLFDGQLYFGGYNKLADPGNWGNWKGTWLKTDRVRSNKWHHAALVLDGRNEVRPDSLQAYLDGKFVDEGDGAGLTVSAANLALGGIGGKILFHDGTSANVPAPEAAAAPAAPGEIKLTPALLDATALSFDGKRASYVAVQPFMGFPQPQFSVELWVKPEKVNHPGTLLSYAASDQNDDAFELYLNGHKHLNILINDRLVSLRGVTALKRGQWQHIAVTWDAASGSLKVYRNAHEVYSAKMGARKPVANGGSLVFGQDQDFLGGGFDPAQAYHGQLNEVRFWDHVRTAEEIKHDMQYRGSGEEAGLSAYWHTQKTAPVAAQPAKTAPDTGTPAHSGKNGHGPLPAKGDNGHGMSQAGPDNGSLFDISSFLEVSELSFEETVTIETATVTQTETAVAVLEVTESEVSGQVVAGPSPQTFRYNQKLLNTTGLVFDGTPQKVIKIRPFLNAPLAELTFEGWIRPDASGHPGTVVSYAANDQNDNAFVVYLYRHRNLTALVNNDLISASGVVALEQRQWQHIAITWRAADGQLTIYRNGQPVYSGQASAGQVLEKGGSLVIGQDQDYLGGGFDPYQSYEGLLNELRFWNYLRTPDQIQADMHNHLSGQEPGLILQWPSTGASERHGHAGKGHGATNGKTPAGQGTNGSIPAGTGEKAPAAPAGVLPAAEGAAFLQGQILDLRVWNTARTQEELGRYRYRQLTGKEPELERWWQFEKVWERQTPDLSGKGHNGLLTPSVKTAAIGALPAYALPVTGLDSMALAQLGEVKRLKEKYSQSIEQLTALWYEIRHTGRLSQRVLFDNVFNPKGSVFEAWPYYFDTPLRWDITGATNQNLSRQIRSRLMGALRVSQDTLNNLVATLSGPGETIVELDGQYLADLYRLARLPGLLRLSVKEFELLLQLMQLDKVNTLERFSQVSKRVDWLQQVGLDVFKLNFLSNDQESASVTFPYTDATIRDLADSLRRQSNELLAGPKTFISAEISELQSRGLYALLSSLKIVDELGAVDPAYTPPASFDKLFFLSAAGAAPDAAEQSLNMSQAAFSNLDQTQLDTLKQNSLINDSGLILDDHGREVLLDPTKADFSDKRLLQFFSGADATTLSTIRESLQRALKIQTDITNRLVGLRDGLQKATLDGLSTLVGATPTRTQAVAQHLASVMTLKQFFVTLFTEVQDDNQPIPAVLTGRPEGFLYKLSKILYLAGQFSLTLDETGVLVDHPDWFSVKNILRPDLSDLTNLNLFNSLKAAFSDVVGNLLAVLATDAQNAKGLLSAIYNLTGWEIRQVESLMAYFGTELEYNRVASLDRLRAIFQLAGLLRVGVEFTTQLSDTTGLDYAFYSRQSAALLEVLRSQYDDDGWATVARPLHDRLAVQGRDALLSRAMLAISPSFAGRRSPDVLSEYLLLDVQTGSEVDTSRLVQAIASLQLYVQRCLMNLEKGIDPASVPTDQWEWMKNYRVWEANRKVFLYPENYIEPELRDDKTPFFEELEQDLIQGELNQELVEKAYTKYLDKFAQVANLKVIGSYYDVAPAKDGQPGQKTLYLVGATRTDPRVYYLRSYINGEQWTPWQQVDINLSGDFVTPVYAFNRVFLFWVDFTKVTEARPILAQKGEEHDAQGYKTDHGVRVTENVDVYKTTIKYSYQNFAREWVQPQEFMTLGRNLEKDEYIRPEWQRIYLQRFERFFPDNFTPAKTDAGKEENVKVFQLASNAPADKSTELKTAITGMDMSQLTWAFLVNFSNNTISNRPDSFTATDKPAGQAVTLLHYDNASLLDKAGNAVMRLIGQGGGAGDHDFYIEAADVIEAIPNAPDAKAINDLKVLRDTAAGDLATAIGNRDNLSGQVIALENQSNPDQNLLQQKREELAQAEQTVINDQQALNSAEQHYQAALVAPKWQTTHVSVTARIGSTQVGQATLDYAKWQQVAVTMNYLPDTKSYSVALLVDGTPAGQAVTVATDRFKRRNNVTLGQSGNLPTQYGTQLSEFQLWNVALPANEIAAMRLERRASGFDDKNRYVFEIPLDGQESGSTINLAASEPALTLDRVVTPVLPTERERILLIWGTDIRKTIKNTLEADQTFNITLVTDETDNYDVDLKANQLMIVSTPGLSINDYATTTQSTLSRLSPEIRAFASTVLNRNYKLTDAEIKQFLPVIAMLSAFGVVRQDPNNPDQLRAILQAFGIGNLTTEKPLPLPPSSLTLLQNIMGAEATFVDVNNQPGWYILDTGDEQFLIEIKTKQPLMTAADRLQFDIDAPATQPGTPQPLEMSYLPDPALEVDNNPALKFQFERLSTFVVHDLSLRLFAGGIDELLSIESQELSEIKFMEKYRPGELVVPPNFDQASGKIKEGIDFNGAYGMYYREIFFHIPFFIANQLNANLKFEEAQKWYHYIFNPTVAAPKSTDPRANPNDRYWQYRPFRNLTLETLQAILSNKEALAEYRRDPFKPHAIARLRINAYQKAIVMKYINNLLDWGDNLFREDNRESINEAVQLYFLAFNILGARPKSKPVKDFRQVGTYHDIVQAHKDAIPDFLVSLDKQSAALAGDGVAVLTPNNNLVLDFAVTENDLFMGYWDRVEDRLFKIRHSLNIEGVFRQLALFQPPINPMALVSALAGGRDLGSVLSDLTVPVPHYRSSIMLDKAKEMASFVSDLGGKLLDALEKKDAEDLAILQNIQERQILQLTTVIKEKEKEAIEESLAALNISRQSIQARHDRFDSLIKNGLNGGEIADLTLRAASIVSKIAAGISDVISENLELTPVITTGAAGLGGTPFLTSSIGGEQVSAIPASLAKGFDTAADVLDKSAEIASKVAEYDRRKGEWEHELLISGHELEENEKQIAIAQLQLDIANQEILIHEKTLEQNQEIASFYREKFTNRELYNWMVSRLSGLYFQAYKLAYDYAKSAEKAVQFELPSNDTFISFGHWDSLKKGLLAGESLLLELSRMEKAHLDRDSRFQEIQKNISMAKSMPDVLKQLKSSGIADFQLSEAMFNRDFPGHYGRMLKTIAISVKTSADIDPFDSVHASLIQLGNKTLLQPDINAVRYLMGVAGAEQPAGDVLRINWRANQQVAISNVQEDSGMFAIDFFFDNRYFPFEGTGAVSSWRLEMPTDTNRFDFNTITDVIVHVKYTALYDSGGFKQAVQNEMRNLQNG
ncbi:MAG TPA: LamG-like jellyroll fold domain-containing protein [Chloroflexia bacterium]|nr:LamG-like jellyroll fold domain-containing protein [Chloroflexia bacterium]